MAPVAVRPLTTGSAAPVAARGVGRENALRHTPPGGRIRVRVGRAPSPPDNAQAPMMLSVEDSGPGVPAVDRPRVLDRFYRVPGTAGHGSGLGLAIVNAIALRHGADVVLDASPELGGLRVTLTFAPATRADNASLSMV